MMSTSCRTSAGGSRAAETRETRRSMFITVPSDSPHVAAGNTTSASSTVSGGTRLGRSGTCLRALSTWFASGIPATGFVATVQQTSTLSRASSSMIRTNPGPDESGSRLSGTPRVGDSLAVSRVVERSVSRPRRLRGADAVPHRVRLSGQREGPLPGPRLPVARQRSINERAVPVP